MDNLEKRKTLCKLQMNLFERFSLELDCEAKEDLLFLSMYIMHKVKRRAISDFNPYVTAGELTKALVAAMDEVAEKIAREIREQNSENEEE